MCSRACSTGVMAVACGLLTFLAATPLRMWLRYGTAVPATLSVCGEIGVCIAGAHLLVWIAWSKKCGRLCPVMRRAVAVASAELAADADSDDGSAYDEFEVYDSDDDMHPFANDPYIQRYQQVFAATLEAEQCDASAADTGEGADDDQVAFTCPVTFERVCGVAGVTAVGNVYSARALATWFSLGRRTDPLTNVRVEPSKVCVVRFETRAQLLRAARDFKERACLADPLFAHLVMTPGSRVQACVRVLGAHRHAPAFAAYSRRLLAALRVGALASDCRQLQVLHEDRVRVLRELGVDPAPFPAEHLFIGVELSLAHVPKESVRVSFSGARITGHARHRRFIDCAWLGTEFSRAGFADCAFVCKPAAFDGAVLLTPTAPVSVHRCAVAASQGAAAKRQLRVMGLPCGT
jgi:hypothetical protein